MMVKQFKKADTFGRDGEWQIDPSQLKEITTSAKQSEIMDIYEEALDELIPILHALGYVEYEGENSGD